jgi:hypothetical protein
MNQVLILQSNINIVGQKKEQDALMKKMGKEQKESQ